jgi:hypothetical protein
MAVREFLDESGRGWRVWPVTPESLHPATKIEEYVDDIYHTGWLVFETVSGDEKRRLGRYPRQWASASDAELRVLLAGADRVQGRGAGPQPARTFRYPGGRYWTVDLIVHREDGDRRALRFTAGARIIELGAWPAGWADFTDEQLVDLLRWAAPRSDIGAPAAGTPRRRWDDRPKRGS